MQSPKFIAGHVNFMEAKFYLDVLWHVDASSACLAVEHETINRSV
jgi:hypothetical protein